MPADKPVTVRLSQHVLRELMGLSVVDESNLAEQIRIAISEYIDKRVAAPDFDEQVEAAKARQGDVLSALMRR